MAGCIWQVQSKAKDINGILGDLSAGFAGEPICLLILYFSPRDDAAALAAAVTQAFAPTPVTDAAPLARSAVAAMAAMAWWRSGWAAPISPPLAP